MAEATQTAAAHSLNLRTNPERLAVMKVARRRVAQLALGQPGIRECPSLINCDNVR